jgi:hypothetical protein
MNTPACPAFFVSALGVDLGIRMNTNKNIMVLLL